MPPQVDTENRNAYEMNQPRELENEAIHFPRWVVIGIPVLLLAMALGARVYRIADENMWFDEHFLYANLQMHSDDGLSGFIKEYRREDCTMMPIYYWIQYFWTRAAGVNVLALRMPSVIFSVLAALALYVFAKKLYGFQAACIALLFACLSNIHIYYGQEMRVYALVFLLSVLVMDSFHRAEHGGGRFWWGVHYITTFLLLFSHFFGAFLLAAQGVYLLIARWRRPSRVVLWTLGHAPAVLLLLWWATTLNYTRLNNPNAAVAVSELLKLVARSITWDACYLPHAIFQGELGIIAPLFSVIGLGWWVFKERSKPNTATTDNSTPRENVLLLLCWLIVPPLCLAILCYLRPSVFQPSYQTRYILYGSFALFVLIGGAISVLKSPWLRNAVTVSVIALMLWHCLSEYRPFRPTDTASAEWILKKKAQGDRVLRSPPWIMLSFLPRLYPNLNLENGHIDIVPPWVKKKEGQAIWVIYSRPGWESELIKHEQTLRDRNFDFERVQTTLTSHTFVYTSLGLYRLDPYVNVIYRVRPRSS
jgi:hypothetical protein